MRKASNTVFLEDLVASCAQAFVRGRRNTAARIRDAAI